MIELGKIQTLKVLRIRDFGVYLGEKDGADSVLLPARQVPEGTKVGDSIEVFIYKDSSDRPIATVSRPLLTMEGPAMLKVREKTKIGAFLDWGLEKDLLLPFREQTGRLRRGDSCLVALYQDKSGRLCATMKVYDHLRSDSPYQAGDSVSGVIYRINPEGGAFVAVDLKYYGLIPAAELYDECGTGDKITARVTAVREDGKLNLSLREKAYLQLNTDAAFIEQTMRDFGGMLPFGEKADPERIRRTLRMSKNAFKRALGHLLKEGKIIIEDNRVLFKR